MVRERPRGRVEPERAPEDRVADRTPDLDVAARADVVRPELELQREEVDGLDEAEAVREVGGVGDAFLRVFDEFLSFFEFLSLSFF